MRSLLIRIALPSLFVLLVAPANWGCHEYPEVLRTDLPEMAGAAGCLDSDGAAGSVSAGGAAESDPADFDRAVITDVGDEPVRNVDPTANCELAAIVNPGHCMSCIRDYCCVEFSSCVGPCEDEFECTQSCLIKIHASHGITTQDEQLDCASDCAGDKQTGALTSEMSDLLTCLLDNSRCSSPCLGG